MIVSSKGWTWTGITTSGTNPLQLDAKDKPAGAWTAEQVTKFLEERMGQNKFYIVCVSFCSLASRSSFPFFTLITILQLCSGGASLMSSYSIPA